MKHYASNRFWLAFDALPEMIRDLARKNFQLLKGNPQHPSLHFKQIGPLWSARIGIHYRALGASVDDGIQWFWIGTHAEYDRLVN